MISDPIADMLTTIRNGFMAHKKEVIVPASKAKTGILEVFKQRNYIEDFEVVEKKIKIKLKYYQKLSAITGIKRISKPGLRIYATVKNIPETFNRQGITVVSTPRGVMTDKEAKKNKLGGEIICQLW